MSDSRAISKEPCPQCRGIGEDTKGDNLVVFDDGHKHCFACEYQEQKGESVEVPIHPKTTFELVKGDFIELKDRHIEEKTCRKYGYRVEPDTGVHIANYIKDGKVIGQKLRTPDKTFTCKGNMSAREVPMFGQHLWKSDGKRIWITEGEIDCLTVYECLGGTWPVVSVPNGAQGAVASVKANLEFLNGFKEINFCFDNDTPGLDAAHKCAALVRPGRARVVHLPAKDPNELWTTSRGDELRTALWQGKHFRPDGIVSAKDIKIPSQFVGKVWDYPWDRMTTATFGRRSGELIMHASGSGMGKSTVFRAMMYNDLLHGENLGCMMLEEGNVDTFHDLMSIRIGKPIRRIMLSRQINTARLNSGLKRLDFDVIDDLSQEEYDDAENWIRQSGLYLYDHFGSQASNTIIGNLEFMVTSLECEKIYLDHISIVISGDDEITDERRELDRLMTKLRSMVERTDAHLDVITHLSKPKSQPFEEGGQISLRDFRGSTSLYGLADSCFGYERNQQHPDKATANTIAVRSLKDRVGGRAGIITALRYSSDTGLLREIDFTQDDDGKLIFDPEGDAVNWDDITTPETVEETTDEKSLI